MPLVGPLCHNFATTSGQQHGGGKEKFRRGMARTTGYGTMNMRTPIAARPALALSCFRREEDGSLIIFALFLFLLMAMMGGVALDVMRYETTRTTLANTLDRCTLMAASLDQRLDPQTVVEDCVAKAGLGDQLQNVTVVDAMNSREVVTTALADTKPMFLHLIGIDSFDAKAVSGATQKITNVEIALVLDVSGSMSGQKISNLRAAAANFVDTMLSNDPDHRISITVVPYNAQVNLGPTLRGKFNATNLHGVADVNCLELPAAAYDAPGIPRSLALPMMAYSDHYYGTSMTNSFVAPTNTSYAVPNFAANYCRKEPRNVVRMASQNATLLKSQINALQAGGNTSIMLGMKWGTALLDPAARSIYSEYIAAGQMPANLAGRPFDYDDAESMKVVVLMTDGEHVAHDRITTPYKTGPSPIYKSLGDGNYSIYHAAQPGNKFWVPHLNAWRATAWTNNSVAADPQDWEEVWAKLKLSYVAWQFYGRPYGTARYNSVMAEMKAVYASVSTMNTQLQVSCTQAKNNGVIVYGIAFEAPTNGQQQISQCASSPQHYFAAQGSQIGTAFDTIASNLTMLKLTQ
jgi:Putative Flp pilus-assembly TadE/G-like